MAISVNALTTLSKVKSALGVTGTSDDTRLEQLINSASKSIENYCNRKFRKTAVSNEKRAGFGGKFLGPVTRPPILSSPSPSITYNDDTVDTDDYEIYNDGEEGMFYAINTCWYSTEQRAVDISKSPYTGQERLRYKISYTGGYVLPWEATAASVQGSNSENFDFTSDLVFTTEIGSTTVSLNGLSAQSADDVITLINAAVTATGYNDVTASENPSGKVLLTHNNNYSTSTLQVTSSNAATELGLSTTASTGDRTLPDDLEQACIEVVTTLYRGDGRDKNITSEKLLSASVSYGGNYSNASKMSVITDYTKSLLGPYCLSRFA